jgi:acyl dehydratase
MRAMNQQSGRRHERSFTVTMTDIVCYAGASGDFTPIHHDPEVARRAGHDRVFAMGMLTAGHLGALLAEAYGAGAIRELVFRFRDRVWLGDTITCTATEDAGQDGVELILVATNQSGGVVVDGSASVLEAAI